MRPVRRIAVLLVAAALIAACGGTGRVRSVDLGRSGNTVVFGGDLYAWVLSGGIVVFDPVTGRVVRELDTEDPTNRALAAGPDGRIYGVTGALVRRYDPGAEQASVTTTLSEGGSRVIFAGDSGLFVGVVTDSAGRIYRLDPDTLAVRAVIEVAGEPVALQENATGLFVATRSRVQSRGELARVELRSNSITSRVELSGLSLHACALAVSFDSGFVVTDTGARQFDPKTLQLEAPIYVDRDRDVYGVVWISASHFALLSDKRVTRFSRTGQTKPASFSVPANLGCGSTIGHSLWLAGESPHTLVRVDLSVEQKGEGG